MDPLRLLAGVASVVGIVWTILQVREKLRAPKPHPLTAALADIAAAIRAGRAA